MAKDKYPKGIFPVVSRMDDSNSFSDWVDELRESCDIAFTLNEQLYHAQVVSHLVSSGLTKDEANDLTRNASNYSFMLGIFLGKLHSNDLKLTFEKLKREKKEDLRKDYFG